nr:2-polyprenyl-3-methyl-6-methoxy-1,4-benzoquinone monooxygenase [Solimicrobium silvestre]
MLNKTDLFIAMLDKSLRVVNGVATDSRPNPAKKIIENSADSQLDDKERRHSAGLMRVNHVGEVCAQALYQSQGLFSHSKELQLQFVQAGREEEDHLAWTAHRISELGSHLSLLNPLWYAGAFVCGAIAAKVGDAASLGFVVETERQVEAHLNSHLTNLPANDVKSRAIVEQMRDDEIAHGAAAQALGAADLPLPVKHLMTGMAKVMTTVAYYV